MHETELPDIEPLRMLNVYLISPGNLNRKIRSQMPSYMKDLDVLAGNVRAYSHRQALAKKLSGSVPVEENMGEILDTLEPALDKESEFYSPGFVQFMRKIYPPKRNIAGWLTNYIVESELGSFRGPPDGRLRKTKEFMVKYGIFDRNSRTVTVPARPTKKFLKAGLRKALMRLHHDELIERYKIIMEQEFMGGPESLEPVGIGPVIVQNSLPF